MFLIEEVGATFVLLPFALRHFNERAVVLKLLNAVNLYLVNRGVKRFMVKFTDITRVIHADCECFPRSSLVL